MKIKLFIIFSLLFGIIFSKPAEDRLPILEITLGKNYPTGVYDKYADSGFSARLAYSRQFKNTEYFRGQFGFQYIHFNTDRSTEYFELSNGVMGPSIDLERRESFLNLSSGTATIPTLGSMVQKGKFSACAFFEVVNALNKVDLPTFGNPTIPHLKPIFIFG